MTDVAGLTSIAAELRAAKAYRLGVMALCESFVEERAAAGDAEAVVLAALVVDSRDRNSEAIFAAELGLLSTAPERL